MKNTLIAIVFVCAIHTSGQSQKIFGDMRYRQTKNLDMPTVEYYSLIFNDTLSFSREIEVKASKDSVAMVSSEMGTTKNTVRGRRNLTPKYYYNSTEGFYFKDIFLDNEILVKEDSLVWKWELVKETKKLGNFVCQKAITKFRGRRYIAWFTNEIPVSFGPWKFHGLPGLILEVYDDKNILHIQATEISINQNKHNFDKDLIDKDLTNTLTIEEYLKKKDILVDDMFAVISSKMPKGIGPMKRDKNCEDCSLDLEIFKGEN